MAYKDRPPLTNEDGDVRELTEADLLWFVDARDFGGFWEAQAFVQEREAFFSAAEVCGIERDVFLPLSPGKPGFLERAAEMLEGLAKSARHAAE
ncbi:hypothetical protein [Tabrizicola sp.]|uniref:hypothetical protein n=1 Tax=Tabrizicola sp. TaxID=2005166 RepID=UPI003F2BE82E